MIMDRETGRSKGFGFIEMSSDDEARMEYQLQVHIASGTKRVGHN